jgi:hypothetical protein
MTLLDKAFKSSALVEETTTDYISFESHREGKLNEIAGRAELT